MTIKMNTTATGVTITLRDTSLSSVLAAIFTVWVVDASFVSVVILKGVLTVVSAKYENEEYYE